ncbi:uncharacterized protein V6R79_019298 [Siganus canaliculatus]
MTMRRSPRRPLILRRRKLPFQQHGPPAAEPQPPNSAPGSKEPAGSAPSQSFPDGIRILDHPSKSDTQVVVIPKTADVQSVIGALTAKGKESGIHGPNKFILLSENGGCDSGLFCQPAAGGTSVSTGSTSGQQVKTETEFCTDTKPVTGIKMWSKELEAPPLDNSLTNIQWLGKMSTSALEPDPLKQLDSKQKLSSSSSSVQAPVENPEAVPQPTSEKPPYSYMAMIQFAINSCKERRMTLKQIYMWIEDHFPYFRDVAKPGWKNSIRHNLSLHDMFIRETSPDGKTSFWTISPESNRYLTLDQVYKPNSEPLTDADPAPLPALSLLHKQQKRMPPDARRTPGGSERRMKPLLPRTESYFLPIQLPVGSSVYLPSPVPHFPPSAQQPRHSSARGAKRVRIAPKVTPSDVAAVVTCLQQSEEVRVKDEPESLPVQCLTPKSRPKQQTSSSRRKQRLVHSAHEEPVLLCPDNTFFDSGVASDASAFQDVRDGELEEQNSPDREFSFKTPIKGSSHLTSSTPSKPPCSAAPEPWKVTPVGKGGDNLLDFSPIRTPGGPAVTPRHDYTTFSLSSTPFKDWPLFNSPRELLQGGGATPGNRSVTEGLVLDTMNDSLSKILVDISFSALDEEDLGTANISWSEFISQLK